MNKKVTSLILVFVMLISMMANTMPVYAASANEFVITADKTQAAAGDTITYSVAIGPIKNFQSANFTLNIPEGLTFVSGAVADGLKELTGATEAGFESTTLTFFHGGLEAYTSDKDTVLMTFQCKVNSAASGTYEIRIEDDYDFADNAWTSYDMRINTTASKVTVAGKDSSTNNGSSNQNTSSNNGSSNQNTSSNNGSSNQNTSSNNSSSNQNTSSNNGSSNQNTSSNNSSSNQNASTASTTPNNTTNATNNTTAPTQGAVSDTDQNDAADMVTTECDHSNTVEYNESDSSDNVQEDDSEIICEDCGEEVAGDLDEVPAASEEHVLDTAPVERKIPVATIAVIALLLVAVIVLVVLKLCTGKKPKGKYVKK